MYCINCGTKLKDDQAFCKRCGTKVNDGGDKLTPKETEADSASSPKAVEVGLGTNEKIATMSSKAGAAVEATKRIDRTATSKSAAQPVKAAAKSPKTPAVARPAGGKTSPLSDSKASARGGESDRASAASASQASATGAKPEPVRPRIGVHSGAAGHAAAMPQAKMPAAASGVGIQPRAVDKPASAKRRRNAIIAIASGSVAAVALAASLFLMTGSIMSVAAETPTVCTKATLVTPQDETGKVLNSYKVSLIDRKTGKEVSSRQVKKDDGFAIGDFQDADGQPITDGDYMLRYEDTESGNVYDGRYIDLRDGDSSAVSSTTGIKGNSEDRRYSDKKEIERLNQELQNWSMREQQWNDERVALSAENEGLKTELGAATQKNGEYEAIIEAGKVELGAKQKAIDEQGAKLEEKQKTIDDQATKLEDAKEQVGSLKKEVEEKQARIDSLEKDLENASGEASDKELKEKQDEIDSLKAEIGKKQAEIDELNKRLAGSGASHHDDADDDAADDEFEDVELDDEFEGGEFDDCENEGEE